MSFIGLVKDNVFSMVPSTLKKGGGHLSVGGYQPSTSGTVHVRLVGMIQIKAIGDSCFWCFSLYSEKSVTVLIYLVLVLFVCLSQLFYFVFKKRCLVKIS